MKKALWFLFSLKGRVSRVPFVVFVITTKLVFLMLDYWAGLTASPQWTSPYIINTVWGLLVIWPLFAVTTKRLHDINRSAYWAWPIFISPLIAFVNGYLIAYLIFTAGLEHLQPEHILGWSLRILSYYILLLHLCLAFWPGTKGANRFGPSPKEKTAPIEATFE